MLAYRILSSIDRSYGLALFWVYVVAFVLAFLMIFVFPPGAIVLLFLALFSLLIIVPFGWALHAIVRALGRRILRGGHCPSCGLGVGAPEIDASGTNVWSCDQCSSRFQDSGEWIDPRMIADVPG